MIAWLLSKLFPVPPTPYEQAKRVLADPDPKYRRTQDGDRARFAKQHRTIARWPKAKSNGLRTVED